VKDIEDRLRETLQVARSTLAGLAAGLGTWQQGQLADVLSAMREVLQGLEEAGAMIAHAHLEWMGVLDAIDDPVFVHDRDFRILRANRAYQQRAGMPFKMFIGRPYYEIFPKHEGPLLRCLHAKETGTDDVIEEISLDGCIYRSRAFPVTGEDGRYLASVHVLEDITERKQQETAVHRANHALRTLSAGNQALIHAADENALLQEMCRVAVEIGGYRMAWIGYTQQDGGIAQKAQAGGSRDDINPLPLPASPDALHTCPVWKAVLHGSTVVVQDIRADPVASSWREAAQQSGYASCIVLPLKEGSHVLGVLTVFDASANVFDTAEVALLEELANDLAFGIVTLRIKAAHLEHEKRLKQNMLQTVEAISDIIEMRDPYTAGHQRRVAHLAQAIARCLGLDEERQQAIYLAGVVHDLGKIRIPAEILSKPGHLDEDEYSLIKRHPQAGYDILKHIDFAWPIAKMVLQHHERLDGTGYPEGLKGEAILPEARILAVADVVEAISSHRPYRPALGESAALDEIVRGKGQRYDAAVVEACLTVLREKKFEGFDAET